MTGSQLGHFGLVLGLLVGVFTGNVASFMLRWTKNFQEGAIMLKPHRFKNATYYGATRDEYIDIVRQLKNYTLDEKCQQHKDFGIGFQWTKPYVNMGGFLDNYVISGVMPHVILEMMKYCCPESNITFAHHFKSAVDIEKHFSDDSELDIFFPIYGLNGRDTVQFKDFPFIPIVTAPKIILLVPDSLFQELNSRTQVLVRTILNMWPMLVFILISAMLSGLIIWLLDKNKNSDEFPPTFFSGAWEGVWWAFVTMTTVGYGDRSPKSPYARAFCIMWILLGIILISLFTGLITTALSVSATPVFNFAGNKIGAVRGSIEYQLAVGLNAEVIGFENPIQMMDNLTKTRRLHGALLDNFILSSESEKLKHSKLRIEREFNHPVTYGIVLKNESKTVEACFRRYARRHPDKIFEIIAKKLKPVKNPTDEVRLEVAAAEKLFYQEEVFKNIVYTETGLLIFAVIAGIIWEFFVRNKNSAPYRMVDRLRSNPKFTNSTTHDLDVKYPATSETNGLVQKNGLDDLIDEYNDFHKNWIERVKHLSRKNSNTNTGV